MADANRITVKDIQSLRTQTESTVSIGDCKRALIECHKDQDKAYAWLKEQKILQLRSTKFENWAFPPAGAESIWGYIYAKAQIFLRMNAGIAEKKWERDFGVPAQYHDKVRSGLEQILAGAGQKREKALRGIGICAFYALVDVLRFRVIMQGAEFGDDDILDTMTLEQPLTGKKVTMFNLVDKPKHHHDVR
jgi:hypothetical protein